ncbi:hypothetical protein V8E53_005638 [Lactarius tabidus]
MTTQSQNKLVLFFLIEGNLRPSSISVPYYHSDGWPVTIDDLRRGIFECHCKDLARMYGNLTIIKIDVALDPEDPEIYFPLLQLDGSGEELSPPTALTEIWREPPSPRRIHAFVTFTNLPMELSGLNLRIKAAHTLYRKVWGEKSDDIFEAVPGRVDYRYLTTQKIDELGLRALSYKAKILLVREEFEITYKELKDYNKPPNESGGVVVTGQPGIGTHCLSSTANSFTNNHHSHDLGKTCFLYYLLLQLLCEMKTVAFQVNNHFVLFQEAGVHFARNASGSEDAGTAIPHGTWALTDSHTDYAQPCKAFVTASGRNCAWLVQTTSPLSNNWSHWHKSQNAYMYWMDVFSFDELSVLGTILHLDLKCLHDNYHLWGPDARTCITLADSKRLPHHQMAVAVASRQFTKEVIQFGDFDSLKLLDPLFSVRPNLQEGSRQAVTVDIATKNILGLVSRAYARQDRATRLRFYKMIRVHSWFSTSAGYFFETHVTFTPHPTCGDNMEFFSNVDELKNVDKNESRKCWVPASQTFPTCDVIVLTNNFVITMTIASKHGAKPSVFENISKSLPSDFLATRDWCHVFLTDRQHKADSLRRQKLTGIPQKMAIHVYSALVSIEEWDSLLAAERVDKMENDRERATQAMETTK